MLRKSMRMHRQTHKTRNNIMNLTCVEMFITFSHDKHVFHVHIYIHNNHNHIHKHTCMLL